MVGEMAEVSVGDDNQASITKECFFILKNNNFSLRFECNIPPLNLQVWAVGAEDRCIYLRTGVVPEELTGRMWRKVQVGVFKIRADRGSTSSSTGSSSGINISAPSPSRHHVHQLGTSSREEKPGQSFMHRATPGLVKILLVIIHGMNELCFYINFFLTDLLLCHVLAI
jgi:hypothetical protein